MKDAMSTTERLVYMANQIARNFAIDGESAAVEATREHIRLYWDPLMRQRIVACLDTPIGTFSDIARRAVELLRNESAGAEARNAI